MLARLLLAGVAALSAPAQDEPVAYGDLVAAFERATVEQRDPDAVVAPLLPDESPFHTKFLHEARRRKGTEEALPYLGWLLQNAPRNRDAHGAAVALLDELAEAAAARRGADFDEQRAYKRSRKAVQHLKYNAVDDETFARTLLDAKVLARAATSEVIRAASERSVFKLENLQVGMVAPDILGKDLDGVEFELSDYRGKVVVLDFWGDW